MVRVTVSHVQRVAPLQIATKMLNAGMSEMPDYKNLRSLGDQYYDPSFEPNRFVLTTITHDQNQVDF